MEKQHLRKNLLEECCNYHSTIKAMKQHKRYCVGVYQSDSTDDSNHDHDDVDNDNEKKDVEVEFVGDDEVFEIVYF